MSHTHVLAVDLNSDHGEPVWVPVNRPHVQLPELPRRNYKEPKTAPNLLGEWHLEPLVEPETPAEVETVKAEVLEPQTKAQPFWIFVWLGILGALLVSGGIIAQQIYDHYTFGS